METNTNATSGSGVEESANQQGHSENNSQNAEGNNENQDNPTYKINMNGVDVDLKASQIIASVHKARKFDSAKFEKSQVVKQLAKYDDIGLDDNMLQALKDARGGNIQAQEYVRKNLFPEGEEAEYTPTVNSNSNGNNSEPYFIEDLKSSNPQGYALFNSEINGDGSMLYNELVSGSTDNQLSANLESLYTDMSNGTYAQVMPVALVLHSTGQAGTFMEAYGKAIDKINSEQNRNNKQQQQPRGANGRSNNSSNSYVDYSSMSPADRTKKLAEERARLRSQAR